MIDTGSITENYGRTVITLGFLESSNKLVFIRSHRHRGNINISIGHQHSWHVFFGSLFTGWCKFCHRTFWSCLGRLSSCVGIDFGIKNKHIDILATCENMVYTPEPDIVSSTVARKNPIGFFGKKHSFVINLFYNRFVEISGKLGFKDITIMFRIFIIIGSCKPSLKSRFEFIRNWTFQSLFHQLSKVVPLLKMS